METYFIILRNHDTKECSIIGALSAEEEIELTNKIAEMQRQNINCNRVSLNIDRSINEEISSLEGNFTLVPINNLFTGERFINID